MWSLEDFEKSELIELIRQNTVWDESESHQLYCAFCIRRKRLEKEIQRESDTIHYCDLLLREIETSHEDCGDKFDWDSIVGFINRCRRMSIEKIGRLKDDLAEVIEEMSNVL